MQRRGFLQSIAALVGVGVTSKAVKAEPVKPAFLDKKDVIDTTNPIPYGNMLEGKHILTSGSPTNGNYNIAIHYDPATRLIILAPNGTPIGFTKN